MRSPRAPCTGPGTELRHAMRLLLCSLMLLSSSCAPAAAERSAPAPLSRAMLMRSEREGGAQPRRELLQSAGSPASPSTGALLVDASACWRNSNFEDQLIVNSYARPANPFTSFPDGSNVLFSLRARGATIVPIRGIPQPAGAGPACTCSTSKKGVCLVPGPFADVPATDPSAIAAAPARRARSLLQTSQITAADGRVYALFTGADATTFGGALDFCVARNQELSPYEASILGGSSLTAVASLCGDQECWINEATVAGTCPFYTPASGTSFLRGNCSVTRAFVCRDRTPSPTSTPAPGPSPTSAPIPLPSGAPLPPADYADDTVDAAGGALTFYGEPVPGFRRVVNNANLATVTPLLSTYLNSPFPTNSWHSPLGLPSTYVPGDNSWAYPHPYGVKPTPRGLACTYPSTTVNTGPPAPPPTAQLSFIQEDILLGAAEIWGPTSVNLGSAGAGRPAWERFDQLVAGLRWDTPDPGAFMRSPVARGQVASTVIYTGALTPRIGSQFLLTSPAVGSTASGRRFVLSFNQGQSWLIASSADITLSFTTNGADVISRPGGELTLRAALLPPSITPAALEPAMDVYAVGGSVAFDPPSGQYSFTFRTSSLSGTGSPDSLLLFAIVHHFVSGLSNTPVPALSTGAYTASRGPLTVVTGNVWNLQVPRLPSVGFTAPRPIDADKVEAVRAALLAEADTFPAESVDPYFFGTQIAQLGRLAVIADELGEAAVAARVRARMQVLLTPWLEGQNRDALLYDTTWGGIISTEGLEQITSNGDFGSALYNDHHFQYGYLIYAAACVARGDAAWAQRVAPAVENLIRDYANPSRNDAFFPFIRSMDVWEGHSWAGGLYTFLDGKNQESSSEAVNSYYAIQLWGLATGNERLEAWGTFLAGMEITSVKEYWHIKPGQQVYQPPFELNFGVGILWSTKADFSTWFGLNLEYIYGINYLPFTPISEELLEPEWVAAHSPRLQPVLANPALDEQWRVVLEAGQAVIQKEAAWAAMLAIPSSGFAAGPSSAFSRTSALYWVATRPG